ncbi:MAG: hypothetical protein ACLFV0_11880 [Nitriliruptoraceae bacterium]
MKDLIRLTVNGDVHEVAVPTHWTLLETLRYAIGLTGSTLGSWSALGGAAGGTGER